MAQVEVGVHDALDRGNNLLGGKAGTGALANFRVFRCIAAKRDLVVLDTGAVEAEDADMPDMMVPAGIDAARDLDLEGADIAFVPERVEAFSDVLRDGDGARGGERAVIHTGASDDVGDQAGIGCCKAMRAQALREWLADQRGGHAAG